MTENAPTFPARRAKTPPFLLLAALLFWGWQSGFASGRRHRGPRAGKRAVHPGALGFDGGGFSPRLEFLHAAGAGAGGLSSSPPTRRAADGAACCILPPPTATRFAGVSATTFLRWLPMTFFLLVAAQMFSQRESVPLSAISWIIRRRRQGSAEAGLRMDLSYPYFMVCLFSAGIHANEVAQSYFWGLAALIGWALWPVRSRRFGAAAWLRALAAAVGLGFSGQRGMGDLQRVLAGYNAQWMAGFLRQRTDPSQSATAIGQIGKLKLSARIVIRLEPKTGGAPPLICARPVTALSPAEANLVFRRLAERFRRRPARDGQRFRLDAAARQNQHVGRHHCLLPRRPLAGHGRPGRIAPAADRQPPPGESSGVHVENQQCRRGAGLRAWGW